jgi:hypothetical protein
MTKRYISALFLVVATTFTLVRASAQSAPAQTPPPESQASASAQASGQGAVGADRSGAKAQGDASSSAAAHAGDNSAQLAGDSSVNAVLTKPVDSRKSKPGDPVNARTTQPARTEDGRSIPKGSTLVGHVSEAHARGEGQADSAVGLVFDKAVTRDGHEISLRNVAIRAVAAAEGVASAGFTDNGMMTGSGGGMAAGRAGGGGLVGRTAGAVGSTVGAGLGAAGSATGSLEASAAGTLQAGPGAVGGVDSSGLLTAASSGVFGLRDLSLSSAASGAGQGSLVTSTGKSVHLDQGTRLLLTTQAGASDETRRGREADAAKPSGPRGSSPDKR